MEEEMLNYYGEIKNSDPPQQIELIHQNEFFGVSALDAIKFSREDYEKRVDALISYAYVSNNQYG